MENNNKVMWIIGGVIAIILIIVLVVVFSKKAVVVAPAPAEDTSQVDGEEDVTTGSINAGVSGGAISLSYKDALVTYKDRRIQLNNQNGLCQAVPNNVTYKNGTNIMIDNRSPNARTVKLGSTFTIKGYGFKIVNVSSSTLPATWLLDCGAQQNVATILIQR